MTISKSYRWRKATDVSCEHALFELMDGGTQILDVGFTDEGVLEVAFNPSTHGIVMPWDHFLTLLDEGKFLAESDR